MNQVKNTVVCMARLLSSYGYISSNFDTIHLKLSTHFTVLFHSTGSKIYFYDVITLVLYFLMLKEGYAMASSKRGRVSKMGKLVASNR